MCLQAQGQAPPAEKGPVGAADLAARRPARVPWLLIAVGAVALLCMVGAAVWQLASPQAAARRAYLSGARALAIGDVDAARRDLRQALRRAPGMAEANLALGFAYLRLTGAGLDDYHLDLMFEGARWGRTDDLDAADEQFDRCIHVARTRPPLEPVRALGASNNRELVGMAWVGKGLTALVRSVAAHDTGHTRDGRAWAAVALQAAEEAHRHGAGGDARTLRRIARELQDLD